MSHSYILYIDTVVAPDALRQWLVMGHGFTASRTWHTRDGTPMLVSDHGALLVEPADPDTSGPRRYRQPRTIEVTLDTNHQTGAEGFLLRVAGDVLQHCSGDAVLDHDTGPTILLRRGETVWVDSNPFDREHLFARSFRPAKLIVGLPSPAAIEANGAGVTV